MQLVDLALAVRVLRAPHPLFAGDEDLQRVRLGNVLHLVIELRAAREEERRDHERDHRPCDFEFQVTFDLLGDFTLAAAAIFDQKVDRRHADQHGEKPRQREQEKIEQVYLEGEVRRLLREEWNLNQEWVHMNNGYWASSLRRVTSQALRLPLRRSLFLLAPQVKEERQKSHQRKAGEDPQQPHQDQGVGPALRIIHITIKNDLIG